MFGVGNPEGCRKQLKSGWLISSERSFSALRRLKTWLRSTMSQSQLNRCVVLNVHREKTDELPMIPLLNEFIGRCETRMRIFGLEKSFVIFFQNIFFFGGGGGGGVPPPPPPPPMSTGL